MGPSDWIALSSVVVATIALVVALWADSRGRAATRTQMFMQLRTSFIDVLQALPPQYRDPDWRPTTPADIAAAARYWHHAYDEWYVSRRLNPALMGELWLTFYRPAIVSGLAHAGLRHALLHMLETQPELADLWVDFTRDIDVRA